MDAINIVWSSTFLKNWFMRLYIIKHFHICREFYEMGFVVIQRVLCNEFSWQGKLIAKNYQSIDFYSYLFWQECITIRCTN